MEKRVERDLRKKLGAGEHLFFLLSDPEKPIPPSTVRRFEEAGADALLIGGSLNITPYDIDSYIAKLRSEGVRLPIILFPGGLNNIARSADAILFMVLLNSIDPYWLIGAQVSAAPIIKKLGIEAIPTGYLIVGHGGAAGHVGRALPVPYENPYIAAAYAAAAELLGLRFLYLEAGSGAPRPLPPEAVAAAKQGGPGLTIIAGGGIRSREAAHGLVKAGADALVIGTLAERDPEAALAVLEAVKHR